MQVTYEKPLDESSDNTTINNLLARPISMAETRLSEDVLIELVNKHLYVKGVQNQAELVSGLGLAASIVSELIAQLKQQAFIEVFTALDNNGLRYGLTDKGRVAALEAMERSGYAGPAPVTLEHYREVCVAQSVYLHEVNQTEMHNAFNDTVIPKDLLDQLGTATHSGRPIFVYGLPGTGKTYITQRISRLLGDRIYVPYAISVDGEIFKLFDPAFHHAVDDTDFPSSEDIFNSNQRHDPRFVYCERPFVMSGGELTMDGLDISVDARTRTQSAPMQLKAANGIYLIDDLGRQRMDIKELFNRWIVPMEEKVDYLMLASGKRFQVPFDVILIFSTNLDPSQLADGAFLRRIGHKIEFKAMPEKEYRKIWSDMLEQRGLDILPEALDYLINQLHVAHDVPLLPSHPRDLSGMINDYLRYVEGRRVVTKELMDYAWKSFFVTFEMDKQAVS